MKSIVAIMLSTCSSWQPVAKQEDTACATLSASILQTRIVQDTDDEKSPRRHATCQVMAYESSDDDLCSTAGPCRPYSSSSWTSTCKGIDTIIVPDGCAVEAASSNDGKGTRWGPFNTSVAVRETDPVIGWDKIRSIRVFPAEASPVTCSVQYSPSGCDGDWEAKLVEPAIQSLTLDACQAKCSENPRCAQIVRNAPPGSDNGVSACFLHDGTCRRSNNTIGTLYSCRRPPLVPMTVPPVIGVRRRTRMLHVQQIRGETTTRHISPQDFRQVKFEISLTNLWTSERYPTEYPPTAALGPIIALTGDGSFSSSGKASSGLKKYAETGDWSQIMQELRRSCGKVYEAKVIDSISEPFEILAARNDPEVIGDTLEILVRLQPSPDWYAYARIGLINMETNSLFVLRSRTEFDDLWWPNIGTSFDAFAEAYDAGAKDGDTYTSSGATTSIDGIRPLRNFSQGPFSGTDGRVLKVNVKRIAFGNAGISSSFPDGNHVNGAGESSSSYFTQELSDRSYDETKKEVFKEGIIYSHQHDFSSVKASAPASKSPTDDIRSGNPKQVSTATWVQSVHADAGDVIQFTYKYVVGFGCKGTQNGPTFDIYIGSQKITTSPEGPFTDYPYDKCGGKGCPMCYSSDRVLTLTATRQLSGDIWTRFTNNGRNMHLQVQTIGIHKALPLPWSEVKTASGGTVSKCRNANGDLPNYCGDRGIYSNSATLNDCKSLCDTHATKCQGFMYKSDWKKCYIVVPINYSATMEASGHWCSNNDTSDGAVSIAKTASYNGGWPCFVILPTPAPTPSPPPTPLPPPLPPPACGAAACAYYYSGIKGNRVHNLLDHSKFNQGAPDHTENISGSFKSRQNYGNNYGVMIESFLNVSVTGNYSFFTRSDDASEVWVSTVPFKKNDLRKVVELTSCCREVAGNVWVNLTAGSPYYIRAFMKQAGGGDYFEVGLQVQNGPKYMPLPESMFAIDTLAPICSNITGAISTVYPCTCGVSIAAAILCTDQLPMCTASNDTDGACHGSSTNSSGA